ncbi:6-bladed beta-propeller [uncultured Rikenella sp.]|uniref:6-bladed beta-propeller n=2 Tax=uncultured Rikenella sp. TaxID=368003 RepID=UPI002623AE83|nr:6-bladed beta-propeller [uncultured Rikenella sp.]
MKAKFSFFVQAATVFTVALFLGCRVRTDAPMARISTKIAPEQAEQNLSDWFDRAEMIELKGIQLANIQQVIIQDTMLIVRAQAANGWIHVFGRSGQYLGSLLPKGKGPREAINVAQVSIVPDKSHTVAVLANFGRHIMLCSLDSMQAVRKITLPENVSGAVQMAVIEGDRYMLYKDYFFTDGPEFKLNLYDAATETVVGQYLPLDKDIARFLAFSQRNNLYRTRQGDIRFYETFGPGIFEYDPHRDSVSLYIRFDKGEYEFPQTLLEDGYADLDAFLDVCLDQQRYIWAHVNCYEIENLVLSLYTYKQANYLNIIDKRTGVSVSMPSVRDDLVTDASITPYRALPIGADDRHCILVAEPWELIQTMNDKQQAGALKAYKTRFPEFSRFIGGLNPDANPVLIILSEREPETSNGEQR